MRKRGVITSTGTLSFVHRYLVVVVVVVVKCVIRVLLLPFDEKKKKKKKKIREEERERERNELRNLVMPCIFYRCKEATPAERRIYDKARIENNDEKVSDGYPYQRESEENGR